MQVSKKTEEKEEVLRDFANIYILILLYTVLAGNKSDWKDI